MARKRSTLPPLAVVPPADTAPEKPRRAPRKKSPYHSTSGRRTHASVIAHAGAARTSSDTCRGPVTPSGQTAQPVAYRHLERLDGRPGRPFGGC